jgi:protein-S-isoprenylcysteine O-methyltransferase Ste14
VLGSAAAEATVTALVGAVLVAYGLSPKARAEERFLAPELGAYVYGTCRPVRRMLGVPLSRTGRR